MRKRGEGGRLREGRGQVGGGYSRAAERVTRSPVCSEGAGVTKCKSTLETRFLATVLLSRLSHLALDKQW